MLARTGRHFLEMVNINNESKEVMEIVVQILALVVMFVIHEVLLTRWLSPLASAVASSTIVTLAFIPFYVRRRRVFAKRVMAPVVVSAVLIYLIEIFSHKLRYCQIFQIAQYVTMAPA